MNEKANKKAGVPAENRPSGTPEDAPKKRSAGRKALHAVWAVIATILMLGIIAGSVAGCVLTVLALDVLQSDSQRIEMDLDVQKLNYTTIFYGVDSTTGETYELKRAFNPNEGSRIWTEYEDMPEYLVNCLVSVEDKRFWEHSGVDFQRTFLSGVNAVLKKLHLPGLYEGTPGASTITQQVVRNLTGDKEVTWQRKVREIFRALTLEKHYSKQQIVETYLNLVSFSRNCKGIRSAANFFFNKEPSELTVAECASIIGTTQSPTEYDPYLNYDANQQRKEYILYSMYEQKYLTKEEYQTAMAEEVVFSTENEQASYDSNQSYFMDYVMDEVITDLAAAKNYTKQEAEAELFSGGYRIYTTVDERVQSILEDVYSDTANLPAVTNETYPQSAFVITDTNGAIKGIVGGVGKKEGARVWNRASDTTRQPGSTIKPITGYVLAFENKLINWSTLIEDKELAIDPDPVSHTQPIWTPQNFDKQFRGYIPVVYALQRSINTIAVQLCQMLTPEYEYDFLTGSLKFTTLSPNDKAYSPMALGSLTNGVTLIEMAGAYQMFSNGGTRTDPYSYTKVVNAQGELILENTGTPTRVISFETATIMNKLLQQNVQGAGTGYYARLDNMVCGGKTGTTDDDVDQWFIGITPYYVGVCWMGYDSRIVLDDNGNPVLDAEGKTIPNTIYYRNGAAYPPPILWKTVMERVCEGLEKKDFPASTNVVQLSYCTETGYAACADCPKTAIGWYTVDNMPSTCPLHSGTDSGIEYHVVGEKTPVDDTTAADSSSSSSSDDN